MKTTPKSAVELLAAYNLNLLLQKEARKNRRKKTLREINGFCIILAAMGCVAAAMVIVISAASALVDDHTKVKAYENRIRSLDDASEMNADFERTNQALIYQNIAELSARIDSITNRLEALEHPPMNYCMGTNFFTTQYFCSLTNGTYQLTNGTNVCAQER